MPRADLVLEGGGVKGIGLVGAISVLMERGYTFQRVAGTSAGSIVGALVAAGFTADELIATVKVVDYASFQDGTPWDEVFVGKAIDLFVHEGVYHGDHLRTWLTEQLASKGRTTFGSIPYTDPDGRAVPPAKAYKLVVNASDITQGRLRQFPWDYQEQYGIDPDSAAIADAVRSSMSIPLFYRPVKLRTTRGDTSWIVDGGMLSNFPVSLFDAPAGVTPRWPTFGIRLCADRSLAQATDANNVQNLPSMLKAILSTLTGFYDRMHINQPDVVARTIFVETGDISSTDFHLSDADRDTLFQNGRDAAVKFLDGGPGHPGWSFDSYVATYRS